MEVKNKHIDFYKILNEQFPYIQSDNIILLYIGEVNHEIIKALLYTLEQFFKRTNLPRYVQKKTFNVMVECIQNIEKHSLKLYNDSLFRKSSILIANVDGNIHVVSSNVINNIQLQFLKQKELQLSGKTKDELRELYKQQLLEGVLSEKGGAGLGFIDMARRTNNNLIFRYYPLVDNLWVFTLNVILKK